MSAAESPTSDPSGNGTSPFVIEVWSDIICPWCYLGRSRLRRAQAEIGDEEAVVVWRAFQLNPDAPRHGEPGAGRPLSEYLEEKFGERIGEGQDRLRELMAEEGLRYRPERGHFVNSLDAHRLVKLAERSGLADDVVARLFEINHAEGGRVDDPERLVGVAAEIGLDPDQVEAALAGNDGADAVRAEIDAAAQIGVRGVPFFVFDRRLAVSGAQPVEVLVEAITQARE